MRKTSERLEYLGNICANEIPIADGNSDEISTNRNLAMQYYHGNPRGDEVENRSDTISMDVSDMVNAVLAIMVPMLSTDVVAEFEPLSEEDEDAAKLEGLAVNKLIIEDNSGFIELQEAIKDGLLMRNACMKVWPMTYSRSRSYNVAAFSEEQVTAFINDAQPGETRTRHSDLVTVTSDAKRICVAAVPVENITYQAGYTGPLQGIRFWAEAMFFTRSDLIQIGVPRTLVEGLTMGGGQPPPTGAVNMARGSKTLPGFSRDQDPISCQECYILTDMDGDGISERYKVLMANGTVPLMWERADLIPYAWGTPFISQHQITGESLFDHLKATQDDKTKLTRQFQDNISTINNGRYIYDPSQTNEEDILKPVAGGGIRSRNPMGVVPLMVPDVSAGILMALTYEDKRRTERGGAALAMMSSDAQIVGETATGIDRQYAAREAMTSMMATNLAETLIRGLYTLTHETMRRYSAEPVMVTVRGKYVQVDPTQWPERKRVNVKTGLTPGARMHLQQTLTQGISFQATAMQSGLNGVLASPDTTYRMLIDLYRMAGISNPERLWIDPSSEAGQQAAKANAEAAQAAQQQQLELVHSQLAIENAKVMQRAQADAADTQLGYAKIDADVAMKEAELASDATVKLHTTRMNNDASIINARNRGINAVNAINQRDS